MINLISPILDPGQLQLVVTHRSNLSSILSGPIRLSMTKSEYMSYECSRTISPQIPMGV